MELGSKFVYLGNAEQDEEDVCYGEGDVVLSDSEDSGSDDDGETCLLDILDTAGQEEYSSMRDAYVRAGDGFVIIYSVTDTQSFTEAEAIHRWVKRIKGDENPVAILVANKQDLDTDVAVTHDQGQTLASKLGVQFFETSAKTGQGIEDAMKGLVKKIPRSSVEYKIVMLGSGAVGKSSITIRFVSDTFIDDYDPTIEDSYRKMIKIKGLEKLDKESRKKIRKNKKGKGKRSRPGSSGIGHDVDSYVPIQQASQSPRPRGSAGPGGGGMNMLGRVFSLFGLSGGSGSKTTTQVKHRRRQVKSASASSLRLASGSSTDAMSEQERRKMKTRKTDGNVVLIPFRELAGDLNMVTGDAITCKGCRAVLTSTGKLEVVGDKSTWTCEFCGCVNSDLDITTDEIPKGESIDFMLAPPTKVDTPTDDGEGAQKKDVTPGTIVYCMDISSSMQSVCQMPESQSAWRAEREGGDHVSSRVSRLECIKQAVQRLAEQLKLEEPEKKVLLVVFSSEVNVKAGGMPTGLPEFSDLERLNMQELLDMGLTMANEYPVVPIEQSYESLSEAVKALCVTGCTALGPALSLCVGYVSKTPCSEVVLCTDGEPNVGVGSLGGHGRYRNANAGDDFYTEIGNYARQKNITINILAVEGASVGLNTVSRAAELSGGTTNKLNPAEIVRQLRLIAQNEVIAYSVTVTFYLHPDFVFDEPDFPSDLNRLEKEVGSVRKEADLSFRFKLKDPSKGTSLTSVPFQVQIKFTRNSDGMKCLRVLSKSMEATKDRKSMEEHINVAVLGVAAMKETAKLAKGGKGKEAQHQLKNVKRLVKRGAKTTDQLEEMVAFKAQVQSWDDELTERNDAFKNAAIDDLGSRAVQQAMSSNHMQTAAVWKKGGVMKARKMEARSKASYYTYKDNMS